MLKELPEKRSPSDAEITSVFQKTQDIRYKRVSEMVEAGHKQQSLMALETPFLEFLASHVIPLAGLEGTFENFAKPFLTATRLPMLPMPKRPRFEPYYDERPASQLGDGKVTMSIAAVVFTSLLVGAKKAMQLDFDLLSTNTTFHGAPLKTVFTGVPALDHILSLIVPTFSDSCAGTDPSHPIQFAYLLSTLFPIILIWTIEGYRQAHSATLVSL